MQRLFSFPDKIGIDLLLWTLAGFLASWLRFIDSNNSQLFSEATLLYIAIGFVIKLSLIVVFGLNRQAWRLVSTADIARIALAVALGTATLFALVHVLRMWDYSIPRSVPLIEGALAMLLIFGMRFVVRFRDNQMALRVSPNERKNVLIIGAGSAGTMTASELQRHTELGYHVVGYLDDDEKAIGQVRYSAPVLGTLAQFAQISQEYKVERAIFAIPTAAGSVVRDIQQQAQRLNIPLQIMPAYFELIDGVVTHSRLREVGVEDLLRRESVPVDLHKVREYIAGKTVLITGAGGSIGSELVRQVFACHPGRVIAVGRGENSIFELEQSLQMRHQQGYPIGELVPVITDVRDRESLRAVFQQHKPELVFHAAAHKHVPLMEANPEQAILNNVVGTKNVVELAKEFGITRLVNISTDKAVRPTSIMGASKRLAEAIVMDAADSEHEYVSVRFGNVLGSRGSVIPRFRAQIKAGGPVEVTHKDMTRYFMTIPEAVQLVLQAGAFAQPGSIYILDMGHPVKIADLAEDLIRLSGLTPHEDIQITYVGIRPGEKLYEELATDLERTETTPHERVNRLQSHADVHALTEHIPEIIALAEQVNRAGIHQRLRELIEFAPNADV